LAQFYIGLIYFIKQLYFSTTVSHIVSYNTVIKMHFITTKWEYL